MKLKSAGVVATLIMAGATNANANILFDIYAGATIGMGAETMFAGHDNDTAAAQAYGAVVGLDIPFVRGELEYNYLDGKDIDMHLGMVNVYAKMPTPIVQPYIGAGVGTIFDGKIKDAHNIDIDADMAYQAMVGVTFNLPIMPLKIDAEARALYIQDVYKIEGATPDMLHYDARVKLRYIF